MSYLIYHKETTVIHGGYNSRYATSGAAKGALTRAVKAGKIIDREKYAISDVGYFHDNIERKVTRKNMMSGKEIEVRVNTPSYMDPSCESYWSM